MTTRRLAAASVLLMLAGSAAPAIAQDSVADAAGTGGDALSPYTTQTHRYVVDLVPATSSWGGSFLVGPILKASEDTDPLFNTLALGSTALSPDLGESVSIGSTSFAEWSSRGAGVAPENTAAGSTSVSLLDRRFGVGLSELNADATNAIGATVGYANGDPTRLYVTRTVAAISRITAGSIDNTTISLGGIDADGNLALRADAFNATDSSNAVLGENIVRVDTASRSAGRNPLFQSSGSNTSFDTGATAYVLDNGQVTTKTPAIAPESISGGSGLGLYLDFAGEYTAEGVGAGTSHLAAGIDAHRGTPALTATSDFGGVAALSSLARSSGGGGLVDSINIAGIDASGAPVAATGATLPSPMPGAPGLNAAGDAEFTQYLSQVSFRGPSGLVAVGSDPVGGAPLAAATATDPTAGDFIAAALFDAPPATWSVVAAVGTPVLDGPGGATIGQIGSTGPVQISAPAIDDRGNVYFVAQYDATVGPDGVGLFKAVRTAAGWELELILAEGDQFTGANSNTTYVIDRLALADSDSLASAAFHAGSVIAEPYAGVAPSGAADPAAFGGLVVSALITYNNQGQAEPYEAVLFVGPNAAPVPTCPGDVNGDGQTDVSDFFALGGNFGTASGATRADGDLNGDGAVDVSDFFILGGDFGCPNN